VPVDARALVEPAIALGGVHTDHEHVAPAGLGEIRNVGAERVVSADVAADVEAVEDDAGFAVRGPYGAGAFAEAAAKAAGSRGAAMKPRLDIRWFISFPPLYCVRFTRPPD